MNRTWMLWLLGLTVLGPGCAPFVDTARTMIFEPVHYCESFDRIKTHCRHKRFAEASLEDYMHVHDPEAPSPDFACGYVDGFTRYLDKGGAGNPPPVPPRQYWRVDNRGPQGRRGAEEWFAGFRAGAAAAMASGLRQVETVPASVANFRSSVGTVQEQTPNSLPGEALPPPREVLPAPLNPGPDLERQIRPKVPGAAPGAVP